MERTFEDKIAVVTGGAHGIGRCIAEEFRKQGALVCIIDKSPGDWYVGDISDKAVKRAGLDYWYLLDLRVYDSIQVFLEEHGDKPLWLATTKGGKRYTDARFEEECWLLFGKETAGLPAWLRERYADRCLRIPMVDEARSMNLGNSVAILCYEALRQRDFAGLKG